ncbi:hypothetical protein [Shimia sp. NS0008-38b]|uniref:hypothetical protein n=1 Tax=Shimia sp. NS0008-38b TaxID=3127653 RepID=UPI00333F0D5F
MGFASCLPFLFGPCFAIDRVLPLIERLFLRGADDFSMIGAYTRNFGDCAQFAEALKAEDLDVQLKRHFFGCATSVAGSKPKDET